MFLMRFSPESLFILTKSLRSPPEHRVYLNISFLDCVTPPLATPAQRYLAVPQGKRSPSNLPLSSSSSLFFVASCSLHDSLFIPFSSFGFFSPPMAFVTPTLSRVGRSFFFLFLNGDRGQTCCNACSSVNSSGPFPSVFLPVEPP